MYKVLFVCTANICRTPIAKYYLRHLVDSENLGELISVDSAGTWAQPGMGPAPNSARVCEENGLDASEHVSSNISAKNMNGVDLILCMSVQHHMDLTAIFPQHADKTFLLTEFAAVNPPKFRSIADPFGRSIELYRIAYQTITAEIDRIFPVIKEQAMAKQTRKSG